MKFTCTRCCKLVNIRDKTREKDIKLLGIDKEDYQYAALCGKCRVKLRTENLR